MICHVNPEKLLRLRRKRKPITPQDITALLQDPNFRAMVQLRKAMRDAARRGRRNDPDYDDYGND